MKFKNEKRIKVFSSTGISYSRGASEGIFVRQILIVYIFHVPISDAVKVSSYKRGGEGVREEH